MVGPNTLENVASEVVNVLPQDIANQLIFLVKTIGGLFALYLIFLGIRLFFNYRNMKNVKKMREDIELIKKKIKIKD